MFEKYTENTSEKARYADLEVISRLEGQIYNYHEAVEKDTLKIRIEIIPDASFSHVREIIHAEFEGDSNVESVIEVAGTEGVVAVSYKSPQNGIRYIEFTLFKIPRL